MILTLSLLPCLPLTFLSSLSPSPSLFPWPSTDIHPSGSNYEDIGILDPNGDENFSIYDVQTKYGG
jgi:hypothetical protein